MRPFVRPLQSSDVGYIKMRSNDQCVLGSQPSGDGRACGTCLFGFVFRGEDQFRTLKKDRIERGISDMKQDCPFGIETIDGMPGPMSKCRNGTNAWPNLSLGF